MCTIMRDARERRPRTFVHNTAFEYTWAERAHNLDEPKANISVDTESKE